MPETLLPLAQKRLPADQDVRDAVSGTLRFDEQNEICITCPIREDAPFREHRAQNLVVLAGAGSGKTHALVWRMVALVRDGVPPAEFRHDISSTQLRE